MTFEEFIKEHYSTFQKFYRRIEHISTLEESYLLERYAENLKWQMVGYSFCLRDFGYPYQDFLSAVNSWFYKIHNAIIQQRHSLDC